MYEPLSIKGLIRFSRSFSFTGTVELQLHLKLDWMYVCVREMIISLRKVSFALQATGFDKIRKHLLEFVSECSVEAFSN